MKNVIIVVVLVGAILMGVMFGLNLVGSQEAKRSELDPPTPKTFTENMIYETIETENIETENIVTWDNANVKSW